MGLFDNLLKALNRVPAWKRLQEVPVELDDLKRQVREEIFSELNGIKRQINEEIPSELDALKNRINEEIVSQLHALNGRVNDLEEKLGDKWPADVCRQCGERGLRLVHAIPVPDAQGYMRENWRCEKCGKYDVKSYIPTSR